MDLATIEMPKEKAQEKFEEYRAAIQKRHDAEDEQIMRGYKVLARGHRVIELSKTIRAGGFTTRNGGTSSWDRQRRYVLPHLAVAWADQPKVYTTGVNAAGGVTFFWNSMLNPLATARNIRMADGTLDLRDVDFTVSEAWRSTSWEAMVPHVPPTMRPARGLKGYHVLWEATWRQTRPRAPRDPALLKRIGGDLYAVVAVWDLTDLERAVLSGRT